MSSIQVKPAKHGTAVPVKTIIADDEHVPVYVGATSDGTLIDEDNPSHMTDASVFAVLQTISECLSQSVTEQKLTNRYLSELIGENLRNDMEQENKL